MEDSTSDQLPEVATRTSEEDLLHSSRNGNLATVNKLLEQKAGGTISLNVNCKGKSKANLGWSPLHLAAYFGHLEVVRSLLDHGADIDVVNDAGDTSLHKAAYTNREDVVMLLLQRNADVSTINAEGSTAKHLTRNPHIRQLIDAAESFEHRKLEEDYLQAAREGLVDKLSALLQDTSRLNINCTDQFGNTALHCAAYRDQKGAAVVLLQNGVNTSAKNAKGQTATELARSDQMRQLLEMPPIQELQKNVQRHEGPMLKKSRFTGWKRTWVVLERGVISFFKNRADAATGSNRRKVRYLDDAQIIHKQHAPGILEILFSDHTVVTLAVENNSQAQVNRQKWENALQAHIAYSSYCSRRTKLDQEEEEEEMEDMLPLGSMQDALQTASAHQQLLEKQVAQATSTINAFSDDRVNNKQVSLAQIRQQLSQIVETSHDMQGSLSHCFTLFTQQEEVRRQQLQQEMEKSRVLQDALHVLAQEHHDLEQSVGGCRSPASLYDSEPDDEFFDCDEYSSTSTADSESLKVPTEPAESRLSPSLNNNEEEKLDTEPPCTLTYQGVMYKVTQDRSKWGGRKRLPVPMFSRSEFSIWTVLKQCIGKELSKITMPVIFNEPLSFLQRLSEYMEYAPLIHRANGCLDPIQRLEYVAAFAVSAIASNWDRLGKPFNPLLGETYELQREDLGFRLIAEQVSHHPPVSAFYVDSPAFSFSGSIHPKLKFWGKSVEVTPKGTVTLHLKQHNEIYTWQNVNCCVHNVIVGKLWMEHYGTMEVLSHKTGHKVVLNFKPSGWSGKDLHKVDGYIYDNKKNKLKALYGKWVEGLYSYDVNVWERYCKEKSKEPSLFQQVLMNGGMKKLSDGEEVPEKGSSCDLKLPGQQLLWQADLRPEDTTKYYNFTLYAMMLNEMEEGQAAILPPTDSRLRPDMRLLEEGEVDKAAAEKVRLEEKQRAARKERKRRKDEWTPRWFRWDVHPHTGKEDWVYTQEYWSKHWQRCPNIF